MLLMSTNRVDNNFFCSSVMATIATFLYIVPFPALSSALFIAF